MFSVQVAARRGLQFKSKDKGLDHKVPTKPLTQHHIVTHESSNFWALVGDFVGLLAIMIGIWASAWAGCALSDACYAAQGGLF